MPSLILNKNELALLLNAARRGDADNGFQELLTMLSRLVDQKTGEMFVSQHTLELIQRYGTGSGNPTWSGLLRCIFGRTLGESLGRRRDDSGHLVEQEEEQQSKAPRQKSRTQRLKMLRRTIRKDDS